MVDGVTDDAAYAAPAAQAGSRLKRRAGELASWRLAAFAAPAIPLMGALLPTAFLLPPLYTGELGMSLATWGLVLLASRIFDVVVDPFLGILCDRYPSRFGRRRHWLVLATPMIMAGGALLFLPKAFVAHPGLIFVLAATTVLHLGYTLFSLNHAAWGGELSDDYHERTRIMGWRGIFEAIAPILTLGAAAVVERTNPAATVGDKLTAVAALVLVLMPVTLVVALLAVRERPAAAPVGRERVRLLDGVKLLAQNAILLRLLGAFILHVTPMAVMVSVNIFYVSFVLEAPGAGASLLLIPFACALVSVPLWMRIAKGREKHHVLSVTYMLQAVVSLWLLFLGPGDIVPFAIQLVLMGLCSGNLFLMRSILTDVVDTDRLVVGEARTGTFFAVLETASKLGPALIGAAIFPLLQLFGFDPTGRHNTPESIAAVKYIFALAPTIPLLAAAAVMWRFPLGSKELAALRAGAAAAQAAE